MSKYKKTKHAIRPNYFAPLQSLKTDEPELDDAVTNDKEQHLRALANQNGWKLLKEFIESEMLALNTLNESEIAKGASFEDIGKNAVMIALCREELRKVINKVEDARQTENN